MTVHVALFLSSNGIALAHRQSAGHWTFLGDTEFSAPDLDKAMAKLRAAGEAREGEHCPTLVMLPDDQILYTSLTAPTDDPELTAFRIEEGLEGLTPYAVSELLYDWRTVDEDRVKLAVVARETLDEARAFAEGHGFNVSGFAATPPQERFPGVPLFDLAPEAHGLSFPEEGIAFGLDTWAEDGAEAETDGDDETATESAPGADEDAVAASTEDGREPDVADESLPDESATDETPETAETGGETDGKDASDAEAAAADAAVDEAAPDTADTDTTDATDADTAETDDAAAEAEAEAADRDPEEVIAAASDAVEAPLGGFGGEVEQDAEDTSASEEATVTAEAQTPPLEDPALTGPVTPLDDEAAAGADDDDLPPAPSSAVLAARKASAAIGSEPTPEFSARRDRVPARDRDDDGSSSTGTRKSRIGGLTDGAPRGDAADQNDVSARNPLAERLSRVRDASRNRGPGGAAEDEDAALRPAPRRGDAKSARPVLPPGRGTGQAEAPRKGRLSGLTAAAQPGDGTRAGPETGTAAGSLGARLKGFVSRVGQNRPGPATEAPEPATNAPSLSADGAGRLSALGAALRGRETDGAPPGSAPARPAPLQTDDDALTGGLLGRKTEQAPGPSIRTGLLLTIILLILLAAIAVWSALFLPDSPVARLFGSGSEVASEDPFDAPAPPEAITAPPAIGEIAGSGAPPGELLDEAPAQASPDLAGTEITPAPEDEAAADGIDLAALEEATEEATEAEPPLPAASEAPAAGTVEVAAAPPVPPLPPLPQDVLPSLEETQAVYEEYRIWQRPPDRPDVAPLDSLSDLSLASVDTAVGALDAVSLPAPRLDPAETLRRIPPPPPFGTSPATDASGLVAATPEGVVTPDGVLVTAGPPPVAAIPRPREVDLPPPAPSFSIEDAILGTFRPTPRPDDLGAVEAPALPNAAPATARASLLQPQPRAIPSTGTGTAAAASLFPGDDAAAEVTEAAAPAPDAGPIDASQFAVARSLVPATRPSDMATLIANADRAAPAPEGPVVEAAAIAPGPSIPSNADVARAATQRGELRLRNINLIGVTGTPSDRRALVRLPSGRFVRVGVGDRLDGGRVAAIGESTLQYVRGGRTVTLDIPG
ncbi:hypothetical protein N8I71_13065 [Roseibacterium sp. SDUM158016]|uniref:hypothetical protein n=1 Tax=Roseicyclus sediminis TaxID=2980997 RepID=UPI0021CED403|nr:hypothetical protein [Roseibacterium sp. SDUM158016]MCU4653768.1 hypothetical protein [Roseibacterium sp. SDUM158016]